MKIPDENSFLRPAQGHRKKFLEISTSIAPVLDLFIFLNLKMSIFPRAGFPGEISNLLKFSDIFTLANVIFGLTAIFFAINHNYDYMIISLFLAVLADYTDGKLAKKLKQQNIFGKELDSLADTISFGVAPAIFGFSLIQTPLAMVSFTIFLFCGVLRLARYNIIDLQDSYAGMPITLNGIIIPIIYLAKLPFDYYQYVYILLGILMVSSLRIRKL